MTERAIRSGEDLYVQVQIFTVTGRLVRTLRANTHFVRCWSVCCVQLSGVVSCRAEPKHLGWEPARMFQLRLAG